MNTTILQEKIMEYELGFLKKENRYECLFCERFSECRRLEINDRIIKEVKQNHKCSDRLPIWINPSCKVSFFMYAEKYYVIGSSEPIATSKYYRVPSEEVRKYVGKIQ